MTVSRHLILFVLGLTPAQQPGSETPGQDAPAPQWTVQGAKAQRALAEDIEIMRRLLNRELLARPMMAFTPDGQTLGMAFSPDGKLLAVGKDGRVRLLEAATGRVLGTHPTSSHGVGLAEGFYLKGHGVIYTLTLPPPAQDPRGQPDKPAPKPVSEWESIRQQLRGEKPTPAQRTETKPPALGEIILRVLARHGHHFKQLGPRESLSVVVTFRQPASGAAGMSMGSDSGMSAGPMSPSSTRPAFTPPPYTGGPGLPAGPGSSGGQPTGSPARDYELAGDLHLKQNRISQAIESYQKALDVRGITPAQTAGLYRKLAQAYLTVANVGVADGAKVVNRDKVITRALEFLQKAVQPDQGKQTEAAIPLPARLIVSAPRALLDAVGSGKMTFEEFRREATVQLDSAPTLDKGPSGGK